MEFFLDNEILGLTQTFRKQGQTSQQIFPNFGKTNKKLITHKCENFYKHFRLNINHEQWQKTGRDASKICRLKLGYLLTKPRMEFQ